MINNELKNTRWWWWMPVLGAFLLEHPAVWVDSTTDRRSQKDRLTIFKWLVWYQAISLFVMLVQIGKTILVDL